ncbi:MAG TPA: hypothetical protein PLP88_00100 [Bacteroidales bacterium]|nr:hypothetical protein [Bacteroidales bacterium]
MKNHTLLKVNLLFTFFLIPAVLLIAQNTGEKLKYNRVQIEYLLAGNHDNAFKTLPLAGETTSGTALVSTYRDGFYQVVISQFQRNGYIEINGELECLSSGSSCVTLRLCFPQQATNFVWYEGLDNHAVMQPGKLYYDTVAVATMLPPDGAFNGNSLSDGGYGDRVGRGTMSFYPLCATGVDGKGKALGVDPALPVVYRLGAETAKGIFAEFDVATSPEAEKFPNRAFFRLCSFDFDNNWGMRSALEHYYAIYPEAFKKRVPVEGIWLPFTPMRSIKNWEELGFAFHETAWNSRDVKEGQQMSNILSDKGSGVLSFQYTEPWDIQLPIWRKNIAYDTLISDAMIPAEHRDYLASSATEDKNGKKQARRLETPWFDSGWAVSITTNCDPDVPGFNRYQYVLQDEITPAVKLNVDGIYFDSMEWNWHHDLNYRKDHFKYTDYPLTFSADVAKPAIWNFVSEFEMMKKVSGEMHRQGKLAMGNGHGWNPFAASNLDLFGAELSWYYSGDHNTKALDFKRAISFQKPIVFLLNEGLNDPAFTEAPYKGYEIYFEKLLAYGFFPSFFSVDASNDPYWQDEKKIENGRPFFKKYIPVIRRIAAAGWQPVTYASCSDKELRVERFGNSDNLYFTVRNNGKTNKKSTVEIQLDKVGINGKIVAEELLGGNGLTVTKNAVAIDIPAESTRVISIRQL